MAIKRIVIFGDSLSDIGNMKDRKVSMFADMNKLGRFSDGRNWVDYLWAYVAKGGDLYKPDASLYHRKLATADSMGKGMELVNYAEGGALAARATTGITSSMDSFKATKILSNLETQMEKYYAERDDTVLPEDETPLLGGSGPAARVKNKDTLHIIWLGGNDVVTVNRAPSAMEDIADSLMLNAVDLTLKVGGSKVVVIDLPDPQFMPRFIGDTYKQKQFEEAAARFNGKLAWYARGGLKNVSILQISKIMSPKFMASKGFAPFHSQGKGMKVGSTISHEDTMTASLLMHEDIGIDESSMHAVVKDQLHPTEGAYEVIATEIIGALKTMKLLA